MLDSLQAALGHTFRDPFLLEKALSHKSQANERRHLIGAGAQDAVHNERLEFLGDAVLQLAVSHALFERFPDESEGRLSKLRASLVNENTLAQVAREFDLGTYLRLGKGELNSGGKDKNSILAAGLEALIGALFLDGGLSAAKDFIEQRFQKLFTEVALVAESLDCKSLLQERVQSEFRRSPQYRVVSELGPDHSKIFEVFVSVGSLGASGQGRSKKEAEQAAARGLLSELERLKTESQLSSAEAKLAPNSIESAANA